MLETAQKYVGRCIRCHRDGKPIAPIAEFVPYRIRKFGNANPERMDNPFWMYMIGYAGGAFGAYRLVFGSSKVQEDHPVWCFRRFGGTRTWVSDREIVVAIGGEHEDWYDDDFCIYNDVIVFNEEASGTEIYGYPRDEFKPTDFHTATLIGDAIYIIGGLGYPEDRDVDRTPVYVLALNTMRIDFLPTHGEKPGWIWKHSVALDESRNAITLQGGKRLVANTPNFSDEALEGVFELDIQSRRWSRLT